MKVYIVSVTIVLMRRNKLLNNKLSHITVLLKKNDKNRHRVIMKKCLSFFCSSLFLVLSVFCLKFFMQQYRLDYSSVDYDFLFERIFMFIMQRSLRASDCLQWLGI